MYKDELSGDLHTNPGVDSTLNEVAEVSGMAAYSEEQLITQEATLYEDINDYLEENPVEDISESLKDLDVAISKVDNLRSTYRGKHNDLRAVMSERYDKHFGKSYEDNMFRIKKYILHAKNDRRQIRESEILEKRETKGKSFTFLLNEGNRLIFDLESTMIRSLEDVSDREVIKRKEELPWIMKNIEVLSSKFPEIMCFAAYGTNDEKELYNLQRRYDKLIVEKNDYMLQLQNEIGRRELDKQDMFNESNLNIKLSKFKGYASSTDVYTFQSNFEKLYVRTTPKRLLSDLLKNNFLEESALAMVKNVDNIDEIWDRLKKAFGDPRMMMNMKLSEINCAEVLLRSRDAEKVTTGLSKVINIMKDLVSLSKQHNIERKLYHGDGLQKIYKLIGESRTTRWLSQTCDENLDEERAWESLQMFLEKDLKVQLQRQRILGKTDVSQEKSHPKDCKYEDRGIRKFHGHYKKSEKDVSLLCCICGEDGHVATVGPGYSKIIQYFTCKRFVEMTPDERFMELKTKRLCFQCLLPGASSYDGKHREGKCQRDFVCKHPSHHRYPRKKHVLVCNEHKNNQENKDLLQEYKSRCILKEKVVELPSFSKDIKLSFHTECVVEVKEDGTIYSDQVVAEKAIYQLQIIKVDGQRYSIFFDSGCGDFVSRYRAVNKIGSKARQECHGPIQLGGVGGITTESLHGIYTVNLPLFNGEEAQLSGVCLDQITTAFPDYPVKGEVEDDIHEAYSHSGGKPELLPKLPKYVGGEIDFMIGIKYLRYHPEKVFQLPSGLTIYRSVFENADGGRGVIGGPHEVFTAIDNYFNLKHNHQLTFFNNQHELYRMGYQINPDLSILGLKYPTRRSA